MTKEEALEALGNSYINGMSAEVLVSLTTFIYHHFDMVEKFKPYGEEVITRKQALSALDTLNASMQEATKVFKTLIDQHFHLVEKKPQVMKLTLGDLTGTVPALVVLNLQYQLNDIQNEIDALLKVKP